MNQKGGFFSSFLLPIMTANLPLIKNALPPLAKSVLIPLGLMAATSATGEAISNKIYGLGMTTLRISKEQMKDVMEIVIYFEESGLLNKCVSKTIENEAK